MRSHLGAVAFAVVLVLSMVLGASLAQAAVRYDATGSFGSTGGGDGQFAPVGRIAVNASNGNVFVIDEAFEYAIAPPRVEVFSPSEESANYLTQFGGGTLVSPTGIAVDSSTGDVYVSDAGAEAIFKFKSDGAPTPTFTLDGAFTSPAAGSGPGEIGSFAAPLAFDAAANRLLVADPANNRVDRLHPDGSFESSFDGSSSGAAFSALKDLTVLTGGEVVVIDGARAERFKGDGSYIAPIAGLPGEPDRVAYSPLGKELLIAHNAFFEAAVYRVDSTTNQFIGSFRKEDGTFDQTIAGLAASASGRLYVATSVFGQHGIQVFAAKLLPSIALDSPSAVTSTSAHLSGTVNPVGQPGTSYHFEYLKEGDSTWASTPEAPAGEGESSEPAAADVTGLTPNFAYQVRLVATNANGSNVSAAVSFSTAVSVPGVVTGIATDLMPDSATLHGTVAPYGPSAAYHFEYGLTDSYGSRVPAGHESVAGTGFDPLPVAQPISGLQPEATYHYRLVAGNSVGQSAGADRTFTTPASPAVQRAYEMVSPVDKNGGHVEGQTSLVNVQASLSGDGVTYGTRSLFPGGEAVPYLPKYSAVRSTDGWTSRGIDPPQEVHSSSVRFYDTLAVSRDNSKALVISQKALAPGASAGDSNVYLRDTVTGAYTTIATSPGGGYVSEVGFASINNPAYVAGTADFSHVVIQGLNYSLKPGTPAGSVYEWTDGELRLVSVQPDGTPFSTGGDQGTPATDRERRRISADGSKIYFIGTDGVLYLRVDGKETLPISVSRKTGEEGVLKPAIFGGMSKDGDVVFFEANELTDKSPKVSVYRYVVSSGELSVVATEADVQRDGFLGVSDDGEYVYLRSTNALRVEAEEGGEEERLGVFGSPNIFSWHAGQLSLVATADNQRDIFMRQAAASPNGRYLAFTQASNLTGYDSDSSSCNKDGFFEVSACRQVYLYSADDDTLECASCPAQGVVPSGETKMGGTKTEFSRHIAQVMLNDGRVFFDTPDPLVRGDSNSVRDVYEFDGEQRTLISAGDGEADSNLADVSPSGNDVFFTTQDRLVGIDTDSLTDLYDARVGGGIAAQNAAPSRSECSGENCREAVAPPPAAPVLGSEALAGPGNGAARKHQRCPKSRQGKKAKASKKARCGKPHKQRAKSNRRRAR